ncbi:MAG: hypothetical protein H0U74_12415 [Bradymonadaceae bacterium]|nr:hypothetical protein [Lujinxingiaceae bacterium]
MRVWAAFVVVAIALLLVAPLSAYSQVSGLGARPDISPAGYLLDARLSLQSSASALGALEPQTGLSAGLEAQAWLRHTTRSLALSDENSPDAPSFSLNVWPFLGTTWGVWAAASLDVNGWLCMGCGAPATEQSALSSDAQAGGWVLLQSGILDLKLRSTYNQPVSFSSRFWRSRRGVLTMGYGISIPAVVRFWDESGWYVAVQSVEVFVDELVDARPGPNNTRSFAHLGRDVLVQARVVEYFHPREYSPLSVSVIAVAVESHATPAPTGGDGLRAEDASVAIAIDMIDIRGISASAGERTLDLSLGFSWLEPVQRRSGEASSDGQSSAEQISMAFRGWLGYGRQRHLQLDAHWAPLERHTPLQTTSYAFGIGTFHRLDPSGLGVDFGGQARGELAFALSAPWSGHFAATGVLADRVQVSRLAAPASVAPIGTRLWMGRLQAGVARPVAFDYLLSLDLWSERSDREDPRRLHALQSYAPSWDFGVELSLVGQLL